MVPLTYKTNFTIRYGVYYDVEKAIDRKSRILWNRDRSNTDPPFLSLSLSLSLSRPHNWIALANGGKEKRESEGMNT